mgnify:CR=1 FL=1
MYLKPNTYILCNSHEELINIQLILHFYGYYHPVHKEKIITTNSKEYNIYILKNKEFYFYKNREVRSELNLTYTEFLNMEI